VAWQLKAEEKQSSQQTQPQEGAVDGEEVAAAAEAQVEKAARGAAEGKQAKATPAAQSAADDDAYDEDEEGSALSDKLEMFITYMLIAGVVGGLGILIYRLSSGGARPAHRSTCWHAARCLPASGVSGLAGISPSRTPRALSVLSVCHGGWTPQSSTSAVG